jgi:YD repeat-containing protein
LVALKLQAALEVRDVDEPIVLINRDVTPENLTVQQGNKIGIIDPYPLLGNGTRFAAWFIHCYRFLLPAYSQTERYFHNGYEEYAHILNEIASGFEKGYIQGDHVLASHIAAEQWLWTLEQAYDDFERLQRETLPEAHTIKHGARKVIQRRLKRALRALENLDF